MLRKEKEIEARARQRDAEEAEIWEAAKRRQREEKHVSCGSPPSHSQVVVG